METLISLIAPFIGEVADGRIDIYNELSLQHELGLSLRNRIENRKLQFERNVGYFFPDKASFSKREIDIAIFSPDRRILDWAIELKFPRNGQYPEQMFSFCKDVAFCEELRAAGFRRAALIIFAEDQLFYKGPAEGIYGFYRGQKILHGRIRKPTGRKDAELNIRGRYTVNWSAVSGPLKYTFIEAQ